MKKAILSIFLFSVLSNQLKAEYVDHRGHNVDSLETVMAHWTADDIAKADEDGLNHVAEDLQELMFGFLQTNGVKSEYYARMLLGISKRFGWLDREQDAAKCIGQHFWAKEQYDSAAFYYGTAMQATEKMATSDRGDDSGKVYDQERIDNSLSQMYGTIGNLYSMMDSIAVAMDYYEKAGVLFKKHGWHNSSSVLYYNMGETMREDGQFEEAERYYKESLDYSLLAKDSLAIATSCKGLGSLYLDMHKTSKAIRYLNEANLYFAEHEDEELQYRMESLDYTSQVLAMQKKRMGIILTVLALVLILSACILCIAIKLKKTAKEKDEISEVLESAVESISASAAKEGIVLKPRERQVLDLIAKGYTNTQIADALNLSPETIKWYKKKLFAMFEASNSADLVRIAKDEGLI